MVSQLLTAQASTTMKGRDLLFNDVGPDLCILTIRTKHTNYTIILEFKITVSSCQGP